jgi:hypothetical protein
MVRIVILMVRVFRRFDFRHLLYAVQEEIRRHQRDELASVASSETAYIPLT